jgi:hypothetical protein
LDAKEAILEGVYSICHQNVDIMTTQKGDLCK